MHSLTRFLAAVIGVIWAYLEPTIPYAILCVFAVLIDCLTAWRLNRRIKQKYPKAKTDGKLKSARMTKMISDLAIVWLCILLAVGVDENLLGHFGGLHLGQYVAAIFVLCTAVSILENESSCNGSAWARAVQMTPKRRNPANHPLPKCPPLLRRSNVMIVRPLVPPARNSPGDCIAAHNFQFSIFNS